MKDYGVRVYRQGVDFRIDKRFRDPQGEAVVVPLGGPRHVYRPRGLITGPSPSSGRRLEFIAANVGICFSSILTLTYRENPVEGETDEKRNFRVASRGKRDLNRFLTCVRHEVGQYLWVQEFQERGVVHFHVLCERGITEQRARLVWCRAIDALHDPAALLHGVKVEAIQSEQGARSYVGRYFGKQRQKSLPGGVSGAGRWWGRSRGLPLALVEEVVTCQWKAQDNNPVEVWVSRQLRRFLTRRLGWKFRGGFFVDWGGKLTGALASMTVALRQWFMDQVERDWEGRRRLLEKYGWESIPAPSDRVYARIWGVQVEQDGVEPVVVCDVDPDALRSSRERWRSLWARRPKYRRGLWVDYFPDVGDIGGLAATAGAGGGGTRVAKPGESGLDRRALESRGDAYSGSGGGVPGHELPADPAD